MVQIVEALCRSETPLSLADIVRRTGHSRATLHAVVTELCAQGWATRLPDGSYTTGTGLVALAWSLSRTDPLTRLARPTLAALSAELGIGCFVARRVGDEVVIIEHLPDDRVPAGADWPATGATLPLRPPVCREFIAWEPAPIRAEWIARAPATLRTRLGLALDAVRERGASIERMTDDHVAVMAALDSLERAHVPDGVRSQVGELLGQLTAIDYLPHELDDTGPRVSVVTVGAPILDISGSATGSVVACPNRQVSRAELDSIVDATRTAAARLSAHTTTSP